MNLKSFFPTPVICYVYRIIMNCYANPTTNTIILFTLQVTAPPAKIFYLFFIFELSTDINLLYKRNKISRIATKEDK